jgi:hypothetical protein
MQSVAARSAAAIDKQAMVLTQEEQKKFDKAVEDLTETVMSVTIWPAVIKSLYLNRTFTEKSEDFLPLLDKLSQNPVARDAAERNNRLKGLTALKEINDLYCNSNGNLRTHIVSVVMKGCSNLYRCVGYGLYQAEQGIPLAETDDNHKDAESNGMHYITSQHDKRIKAEINILGSSEWREHKSSTPPSPPLSTATSETHTSSTALPPPNAMTVAHGNGTMAPVVMALSPHLPAEEMGSCFAMFFRRKRRSPDSATSGAAVTNSTGRTLTTT